MGEKKSRNTRVLSLFVRLSYGDILNKKEEACHYQVTERTIQRDLETIRSVLEEERKKGRDDRMLLYDRGQNGYKICRVYETRKKIQKKGVCENGWSFAISVLYSWLLGMRSDDLCK